jgi:hypothetical protein
LCCTAEGRSNVENREEAQEKHFGVETGVHLSGKRLEPSPSMRVSMTIKSRTR